MDFVFVDETGDPGPGPASKPGSSLVFGIALLHATDAHYPGIRRMLAAIRWHFDFDSEFKIHLDDRPNRLLIRIVETLEELIGGERIHVSAICVNKERYRGRYMRWSEFGVPGEDWPRYFRNYVLRSLLEFHFAAFDQLPREFELITDRVDFSEEQRANLIRYLQSAPPIPLRTPFRLPRLGQFVNADSRYVGGLQVAHVLAELAKAIATENIPDWIREKLPSLRFASLLGSPPQS